jgi:hypothetical protein
MCVTIEKDLLFMPVQRPRDWKREKDAELSAGLEESGHILVKSNLCSLCNIGIGPNHVEQEIYLYPIYQKSMWDANDNWVYVENQWIFCCGHCARHKRRCLPELFLLVDYREQRQEKDDLSIDQRIEALLFLLTLYVLHLPVRLFTITPYFSLAAFKPAPRVLSHTFLSRKGVPYPAALMKTQAYI